MDDHSLDCTGVAADLSGAPEILFRFDRKWTVSGQRMMARDFRHKSEIFTRVAMALELDNPKQLQVRPKS